MNHDPKDQELEELLRQIGQTVEGREPTPPVRNFSNGYGATRRPTGQGPVIPAYNPDFEAARRAGHLPHGAPQEEAPEEDPWEEDFPEEFFPEEEAPEEDRQEDPAQDPEDWEEEEETPEELARTPKEKKMKKRRSCGCGCTTMLLMFALLIGGAILALCLWLSPPETDDPIGARKDGATTILLCGTDIDGTRTDTMMLLYLNPKENAVNLVSLPRDTLTHTTAGKNAKLNSAFGRNNGKTDPEEGMENLLEYVKDIIGYKPDGYILITLDGFIDIVDAMGGVEFDVPQDMYYNDPSQNLFIDLKKGVQQLSGYEAMCLVRFRKGYENQDLGRVSVQREFLTACMDQWLSLGNIGKLPQVLSTLKVGSTTDLTTGNLLWLAFNGWKAGLGNMKTETLPGYATMISGASYYVLYPKEVAALVNSTCNPYEVTITAGDLNIVGK